MSALLRRQPAQIAGMFDAIAPRYDLLNRLLSVGLDQRWRARALAALALRDGDVLLDLCTGTGDLAIAAGRYARLRRVVGIDFAARMLALAREKAARVQRPPQFARGDAMCLPLPVSSVDAVTIGFGIRNVEDYGAALREVHRVLRPGGRLAILEFGTPARAPFRALYLWYFRHVLPRVGRLLSRHGQAYGYLPASVGRFPPPNEFTAALRATGFETAHAVPLTLGVVYLYTAARGAQQDGGRV